MITIEDVEEAQRKMIESMRNFGSVYYAINLNGTFTMFDPEDIYRPISEDANKNPI